MSDAQIEELAAKVAPYLERCVARFDELYPGHEHNVAISLSRTESLALATVLRDLAKTESAARSAATALNGLWRFSTNDCKTCFCPAVIRRSGDKHHEAECVAANAALTALRALGIEP